MVNLKFKFISSRFCFLRVNAKISFDIQREKNLYDERDYEEVVGKPHNLKIIQYIFDFFICLFIWYFLSLVFDVEFFLPVFLRAGKREIKTFRFSFRVRRKEFLLCARLEVWEKHEVFNSAVFVECIFVSFVGC